MAGKRGNGEDSIYQYGDRWHVQGWINGKRARVSAKKRGDALARWQERLRAKVEPAVAPLGEIVTVADALEQWFNLSQHRWAYTTRVGYRHAIDKQLIPHLGTLRAEQLGVRHVETWQHRLLTCGLSPATIRQARIVLGQAMDMLVRYGQLTRNPVSSAAALPKSAAEPAFLTEPEAAAVIAAAEDPSDRARWLLALSLGLRSGEVLGLRWEDLDLEAEPPRLTVTGSLQFQSGRGLVRVAPKTAHSRRTVILGEAHVLSLRAVRTQQARLRLADAGDFNPAGYVFVTKRGTPVDTANDTKRWHALLHRAGVRKVRRHDARHTAATLMLSSGASLANVQKTLGHASIRTTVDVYGHLDAADSAAFTSQIAGTLAGRSFPLVETHPA